MALTLVGCSGDDEGGGAYESADAERLAEITPVTPGWSPWPREPEPEEPSGDSPEEAAARDPIFAAYRRATAEVESYAESGNRWKDDDKLGNLTVGVADTPPDAHVAFLASNELSRAYGAKYGTVDQAEAVEGLGDEAWRLWAHGNGSQVTYHWRRGNLVVEAHLHCYGECEPGADADVDAAARAWADAIDEEARAISG